MVDPKQAYKHATANREELARSGQAACFYCRQFFPAKTVERWLNDGTAFCPLCQIDSVIGDASSLPMTDDFLRLMHHHWFERNPAEDF
jgi:hypothetical protein